MIAHLLESLNSQTNVDDFKHVRDAEERNICWQEGNGADTLEISVAFSYKHTPSGPEILLLVIYPNEMEPIILAQKLRQTFRAT